MSEDTPSIKVVTGEVEVLIPNCPKTLRIKGGGTIDVKALSTSALINIGELWLTQLFKNAGKKPDTQDQGQ